MKALIFTALVAILFLVVLVGSERRGYLMPSQEPAAYSARLIIAEEVASKHFEETFGSSSKTAKSMEESISGLKQKHPGIIASNRAEVNRIYDSWRAKIGNFQRQASAHFFARHFTRVALERMRDGRRPMFADVRAIVVWRMRRNELQLIADRTKSYAICLLFVDVLPSLRALGVPKLGNFEEQRLNCERLIASGLFDPKNAVLNPSDLGQ